MKWTTTTRPTNLMAFTAAVGPTVEIPASPSGILDLFFTEDMWETIANESNIYAAQAMLKKHSSIDIYETWTKITSDEVKAYMGLCLLMSINHLPSLSDYWSKDPCLRYAPVADRMSRDRFRDITRYLHFVNNDTLPQNGQPGYDKIGKVRPIIEELQHRFQEVYQPNREVAVDEAMIKFQGRSTMKQYMPLKPIKRGIKVWMLGDSINGFICRFKVSKR
jgi:hypothetical protein